MHRLMFRFCIITYVITTPVLILSLPNRIQAHLLITWVYLYFSICIIVKNISCENFSQLLTSIVRSYSFLEFECSHFLFITDVYRMIFCCDL